MHIDDIDQFLNQEFSTFEIGRKKFPQLFHGGLSNSAIHSSGISYLLGIGLEFGLPVIAEYPIYIHADQRWKNTGKVIPDSIWFHPKSLSPWIAFEFERFEPGDENKIKSKVKNLVLSYYQSNTQIECCVLIYWLRSGVAPRNISSVIKIFKDGFLQNNRRVEPPNCKLLVYKFVSSIKKDTVDPTSKWTKENNSIYSISPEFVERLVIWGANKVEGISK